MSKSSQGALRSRLHDFNENLKRMRPSSFDSFKTFLTRSSRGSYASNHGSVPVPMPVPELPASPRHTGLAMAENPSSPVTSNSPAESPSPADDFSNKKKSKSPKKVKTERTEEEKREYNRQKASKSMKGLANDTIEMGEILKQNRDILQQNQIDLPEEADGGRPMQKPAIVRTAKTALKKLLPRFAAIRGLRAEKEGLENECTQLSRQRENMLIMIQSLQLQMDKLRIEVDGLNDEKSSLLNDVQGLLLRRETLINEVSVAQQHVQALNQQLNQNMRQLGPRVKPRQLPGRSSLEHEVLPDT